MWEYLTVAIQPRNPFLLLLDNISNLINIYEVLEATIVRVDGNASIERLVDEAAYQFEDLMLNDHSAKCWWFGENSSDCTTTDYWQTILTVYGNCMSFNYNRSRAGRSFHQDKWGANNGLMVSVNIDQSQYTGKTSSLYKRHQCRAYLSNSLCSMASLH